jgi:hypothetical protein
MVRKYSSAQSWSTYFTGKDDEDILLLVRRLCTKKVMALTIRPMSVGDPGAAQVQVDEPWSFTRPDSSASGMFNPRTSIRRTRGPGQRSPYEAKVRDGSKRQRLRAHAAFNTTINEPSGSFPQAYASGLTFRGHFMVYKATSAQGDRTFEDSTFGGHVPHVIHASFELESSKM